MNSKNQSNAVGCTSIAVFLLAFWLAVGGGVMYIVSIINKVSEIVAL